jgi:hypothetical protein
MEHVRGRGLHGALQDRLQPAWTALSGGCRPNRDSERNVEAAGLRIEPETVRARGVMRRFQARRPASPADPAGRRAPGQAG